MADYLTIEDVKNELDHALNLLELLQEEAEDSNEIFTKMLNSRDDFEREDSIKVMIYNYENRGKLSDTLLSDVFDKIKAQSTRLAQLVNDDKAKSNQ